jgi:hypothetical protein
MLSPAGNHAYEGGIMIECECDEPDFSNKFPRLASQILAENHMSNISSIKVLASMVHGYVIISAALKGISAPSPLRRYAKFERASGGVMVRINEEDEPRIPAIVNMLTNKFGERAIRAEGRFDIAVADVAVNDISEMAVPEEKDVLIDNTFQVLTFMIPEGFRISRILRGQYRITMIWSQNPPETGWIEKMQELHGSEI